MLKSWTIENFKSISERTTLNLAPLTIFAGENSSGKSTVIQSILLVAQTLQSRSWGRCIVLNGNIIRLGSFSDILSNGTMNSSISIGFELATDPIQYSSLNYQKFVYISDEYRRQVKNVRCHFSFSAENSDGRENLQLHPRLESSSIDISYHDDENRLKTDEVLIRRRKSSINGILAEEKITDHDGDLEQVLSYSIEKPKGYKPRVRGIPVNSGKPLGCLCRHFLPKFLAFSYDGLEAKCNSAIESILPNLGRRSSVLGSEAARAFDFLATNERAKDLLLSLLIETIRNGQDSVRFNINYHFKNLKSDFTLENWQKVTRYMGLLNRRLLTQRLNEDELIAKLRNFLKDGYSPENKIGYGPFDFRFDQSIDYIEGYISTHVKYVGPLRDEPKPVYPLGGGSDSYDVGYRGELTAAVLETHRNSPVGYISSQDFQRLGYSAKIQEITLLEAVKDWLAYIGVADSVETSDKGKLGHELKISPMGSTTMHDLTHVGVGVSQLLPILVQSLLMPSGTVLILEQPELHLHPRVQSRLADFLVSLSLSGKQCIVETHSEYLINKLRFLSANADDDKISKISTIYFVEKRNGSSIYNPISINEYGVITNWPKGFFDEAETLASETIKAAVKKRKKRAMQATDTTARQSAEGKVEE